jgi:ABC-type Mn2+/Zn2+ transport system permease subunit
VSGAPVLAAFDPFADGILRRALAEVVLLGIACGPVGVWVLRWRHAFAAESFSHAMLPGLVAGALIGAPLAAGAAGGVVVAAVLVALASRAPRIDPQLAIAVTVTGLFGAGALLALSPDVPPRLTQLLFGDPLGATGPDILLAAGIAVAVLATLAAGHRAMVVSTFDAGAARSMGAHPRRVELGVLVLLGLCLVAAVQGVGNLLALALVVAPAAAAHTVGGRLGAQLVVAGLLGATAGIGGLAASYAFDLAAGPAIALTACAIVVLAGLVAPGSRLRSSPAGRLPAH